MKSQTIILLMVITGLVAACQTSPSTPIQVPSKTPILTTASMPTLMVIPTATVGKPVIITAFCTLIGKESKTEVPLGTPIIITWGWDAKTETQITDFLQNNVTEIKLDGKVIEGKRSGGILKNEKSGNPEVVWSSEVGVLEPGTHTITYDVKWKKMIDDGTNKYGPGSKNETEHDVCQITVK